MEVERELGVKATFADSHVVLARGDGRRFDVTRVVHQVLVGQEQHRHQPLLEVAVVVCNVVQRQQRTRLGVLNFPVDLRIRIGDLQLEAAVRCGVECGSEGSRLQAAP